MWFILVVLMVIFYIYSVFVFCSWLPHLNPDVEALDLQDQAEMADWTSCWRWAGVCILPIFHFTFSMLLAALYQCIMTDPGLVPPNWGFYMGDETKRRRYCKMCNVWKPDRTHHCSICDRCILNMDHHCPWVNNCVGFYNRKFFMQLLFYVYASLSVVLLTSIPDLYLRGSRVSESYTNLMWEDVLVLFEVMLALLMTVTLTNFIKFHMKLVSDNFTTIENLEREEGVKSKYDIGLRRNWEQVFGTNVWMWWLPMHTPSSRPVGDGSRWRVHYTRVVDEDEELPPDDY